MKEIIKEVALDISELVRVHGHSQQLFGTWNGDLTSNKSELHDLLESELAKHGVKTIKVYDYADLYVPQDISEAEEKKLTDQSKELSPVAYELAVAEMAKKRREAQALDSLAHAFADILADIIFGDDQD